VTSIVRITDVKLIDNKRSRNTERIKKRLWSETLVTVEAEHTPDIDPGLFILLLSLRQRGIDAEVETVRQLCGSDPVGVAAMLRCAKELGLKARSLRAKWARLTNVSLPVIAVMRDGGSLFISKVTGHEVTALQLALPRRRTLTRAEFETAWDGRLVAIEHRGSLSSFGHRLVFQLTNMATRVRVISQHVGKFLMPVATEIDEPPLKHTAESAGAHPDDPGLAALVMLLRCHGVGVDSAQIRHRCGTATVGIAEMLRCGGWRAPRYLRSRSCVTAVFSSLERLARTRRSSRSRRPPDQKR
jgi:subfamily B ATP-binding cassette protein HlyB/CyaB